MKKTIFLAAFLSSTISFGHDTNSIADVSFELGAPGSNSFGQCVAKAAVTHVLSQSTSTQTYVFHSVATSGVVQDEPPYVDGLLHFFTKIPGAQTLGRFDLQIKSIDKNGWEFRSNGHGELYIYSHLASRFAQVLEFPDGNPDANPVTLGTVDMSVCK